MSQATRDMVPFCVTPSAIRFFDKIGGLVGFITVYIYIQSVKYRNDVLFIMVLLLHTRYSFVLRGISGTANHLCLLHDICGK